MALRFIGLPAGDFQTLIGADDRALAERGVHRRIADEKPGFPCRVSLEDAEPGEKVLLLTYRHLGIGSPYDASGPIFVRESARETFDQVGVVPPVLRGRFLSLRAYDPSGMMVDADTTDGDEVETLLDRLFARDVVDFVHVHNARRGCYACRVVRG